MLVLAVDTSAARGSLALADDNFQILSSREWEKKAMHSDVATLELQALLADAQKSLNDITHIVVNHGPGSFTGLRVGINLARTLAYSLDVPILPLCTLEVLAFKNSREGEKVCVAVHALQTFVYAAVYRNELGFMVGVTPPASVDVTDLLSFSAGASNYFDQHVRLDQGTVKTIDSFTSATTLVEYVAKSFSKFSFLSWKDISPLYIRASEPEEKMRRGLLKPV